MRKPMEIHLGLLCTSTCEQLTENPHHVRAEQRHRVAAGRTRYSRSCDNMPRTAESTRPMAPMPGQWLQCQANGSNTRPSCANMPRTAERNETWSNFEEGSYLKLVDFSIIQLLA